MSEEKWLDKEIDPYWLIGELRGTSLPRTKVGRRKLRLFACGCCRLIWSNLSDARLRAAVNVAEQFADGNGTATELKAAGAAAHKTIAKNSRGFGEDDPNAQLHTAVEMATSATTAKPLSAALGMVMFPFPLAGYRGPPEEANSLICDLLRDIFGNPFRSVSFSPSWRTDTTRSLARTMYDAREFSAMPILADALQDAGCDSADVLDHCRDPKQVHVRGCWVVDLVLGKA